MRKFDRSASGKSTNVQSDTETSSTALPSGQSSDREGSSRERWRRGIRFAETRPDPVRMGSFLVHFPREDPHQGSVASGTKGKTPRAEASATTGRRAPDIYRPPGARVSSGSELQALDKDPGARVSSGGGDLRAADKDSPKIKQEEPSEGKAGSGYM